MRLRATALIITLAVLIGYPLAAEVTGQVQCGIGGKSRSEGMLPVRVELRNTTPAVRGELTTSYGDTTYVLPVDLPENSHKIYTLYLPAQLRFLNLDTPTGSLPLQLSTPGYVNHDEALVVVVGGESGYLQFLTRRPNYGSGPSGPGGSARQTGITVAQIGWEELPETWLGWEGVSTVILGDANCNTASAKGLQTLTQWVQAGGKLIVPGGTTGAALAGNATFKPLLPVQVTGTQAVPEGLAPLTQWLGQAAPPGPALLLSGSPAADAQTWTPPLITEKSYGSGTVLMTAFDSTTPPMKYWNGNQKLWQVLLGGDQAAASFLRDNSGAAQSMSLMNPFKEANLPSLWFAVIFLGLYLLALAPGQYLLLQRIDRRELAWVVTPALVLAFTLGGMALGTGWRLKSPVLRRVCVLHAPSGGTIGTGWLKIGLYSPRTRTYRLSFSEQVAALRVTERGDDHYNRYSSSSSLPDTSQAHTRIVCGAEPRIEKLRLKTGTHVGISGQVLAPLGQGLTVQDARWDGSHIRLKVTNGTPYTFSKLYLTGPTLMETDGLRPGETRELTTHPSAGNGGMGSSGADTHGRGNRRSRESDFENGDWELVRQLSDSQERDSNLFAVASTPLVRAEFSSRAKTHDLNILCVPLKITVATTGILPDWTLTHRSSHAGPDNGGWYFCEYQLPSTPGCQVMKVLGNCDFSQAAPPPPLEAFNFVTNQWSTVLVISGTWDLEPAQQFVSQTGVIRLRATSPLTPDKSMPTYYPSAPPMPPIPPPGTLSKPGARITNIRMRLQVFIMQGGGQTR